MVRPFILQVPLMWKLPSSSQDTYSHQRQITPKPFAKT